MSGEPGHRISEEDRLFGELVVSQGLTDPEQVKECMESLLRLIDADVRPLPKLGELLIKKGYLSRDQMNQTLRAADSGPSAAPANLSSSQESDLPAEVVEAARNPGNQSGKYIRTRKLGAGGMGEVWQAWDTELRRYSALKFLKYDDSEELARFKREAQTAAKLNHPNIGAVYEVGEWGEESKPFISMQFVDGQTLDSFPRDDVKLIAELVRDGALAVHSANESGIIHRDLKPGNIMVEGKPPAKKGTGRKPPGFRRTEGLRVFVLDFGLAKETQLKSGVSVSGQIIGTPSFMPPEQARGVTSKIDARSDVYSLGATLYTLLTDRPPFKAENLYDVLQKVIDEDPRPVRKRRSAVPPDLETIVMKCLEKDPARRYANAQDLADDLTRFLDGEPIEAHPPSAFYRIRKRLAKKKAVVLMAGIATLAILVGAGIGLWQWTVTRDRELGVYPLVERAREQIRSARDMFLRDRYPHRDWLARLDEAERNCREAIRLHPGYAPAYLVRGLVEMERGRIDDAIEYFGQAIEKNSSYDQAYLERANAFAEKVFEIEQSVFVRANLNLQVETRQEREFLSRARADLSHVRLDSVGREERRAAELLFSMLTKGPEGMVARIKSDIEEGVLDEMAWRIAGEASHRLAYHLQAAACYQRYLRVWKGDARGWGRMAQLLSKARKVDAAIEAADRALRLYPEIAIGRLGRAMAYEVQLDWESALKEYSRIIKHHPRNVMAYNRRAAVRISLSYRGEYLEKKESAEELRRLAIADTKQALQISPNSEVAHFYSAMANQLLGNSEEADAACVRMIELNPRFNLAYSLRSRIAYFKKEYKAAVKFAEQAIEISPKSAGAYYSLGRTLIDQWKTSGVLDRSPQAMADRKRGLAALDRAIELDDKDASQFNFRGFERTLDENYEGAVEDLTRAIELQPGFVRAHHTRANALSFLGRRKQALDDLDRALELNPDFALAHYDRGRILYELGRYREALPSANRAIELEMNQDWVFILRGRIYTELGEYRSGVRDLSRAIKRNPAGQIAFYNRARCHLKLGLLDQALRDLDRSIELDPDHASSYFRRGQIYGRRKKTRLAVSDYTRTLELNPDYTLAYLNRGNERLASGDAKGALSDFERLVELEPRSSIGY